MSYLFIWKTYFGCCSGNFHADNFNGRMNRQKHFIVKFHKFSVQEITLVQ